MGRPPKYPEQFRLDAVALVETSDRSIHEVAGSLGIADGTLWHWVKQARAVVEAAANPAVLSGAERDELRRLRKENAELRKDTEILKRAAAYFARETIR